MRLFVCAQDLSFFWIGLLKEDGSFFVLEKKTVPPESYLATLDAFLDDQHLKLGNLLGITVVTGPGSFTASRVSLTIVNTLHFTHQLPLFVLENKEHLEPKALLSAMGTGAPLEPGAYAHPFYDRPPNITSPLDRSS